MKRYFRLACAMVCGLAFAGGATVADVCPSHVTSINPAGPFFASCGTTGSGYGVYVWGSLFGAVSIDNGPTAGGAGQIIQILQSSSSSGANYSVAYTTNWYNICDIPCGTQNYQLHTTTSSTPALVPCRSSDGEQQYYAVYGLIGTNLLSNPNHSPCDGQGSWLAVGKMTSWVPANASKTACCLP